MDSDNQSGSFLANAAIYAQIALLMLIGVYVVWLVMCGLDAQIVILSKPEIAEQVKAVTGIDFNDASTIPTMGGESEQLVALLRIVAPRMHWFAVAIVTSLVCFPPLGYLLGRSAFNVSWAGLLPIIGVIAGMNPAFVSDPEYGIPFGLERQIVVLAVQIVLVQLCANYAWNRRFQSFMVSCCKEKASDLGALLDEKEMLYLSSKAKEIAAQERAKAEKEQATEGQTKEQEANDSDSENKPHNKEQ